MKEKIRVDFRHACLFPELVLHEGERDDDHQDSGRVEHVIGLVHVEFLRQPVIKFQVEGRIPTMMSKRCSGLYSCMSLSRYELPGRGIWQRHRLAVNVDP